MIYISMGKEKEEEKEKEDERKQGRKKMTKRKEERRRSQFAVRHGGWWGSGMVDGGWCFQRFDRVLAFHSPHVLGDWVSVNNINDGEMEGDQHTSVSYTEYHSYRT